MLVFPHRHGEPFRIQADMRPSRLAFSLRSNWTLRVVLHRHEIGRRRLSQATRPASPPSSRLLQCIGEAAGARQKWLRKRSLRAVNEHAETPRRGPFLTQHRHSRYFLNHRLANSPDQCPAGWPCSGVSATYPRFADQVIPRIKARGCSNNSVAMEGRHTRPSTIAGSGASGERAGRFIRHCT